MFASSGIRTRTIVCGSPLKRNCFWRAAARVSHRRRFACRQSAVLTQKPLARTHGFWRLFPVPWSGTWGVLQVVFAERGELALRIDERTAGNLGVMRRHP